jgi:cytidine deaminase
MEKKYSKIARDLIREVEEAAGLAHVPHSGIQVGAVLYAGPGQTYRGMNVESASYSLTVCAERVALHHALARGKRDFRLMVLYSPQVDFILPCGACLQVLIEWAPDLVIATMNRHREFKFYPLPTLLPRPFLIPTGGR